jgi:excisionase family DNA binding protein
MPERVHFPDFKTIPEVAKQLRVSQITIRRLISKGTLPHIRVGQRIVISENQISEFLSHSTRSPFAKEVVNE